MSAIADLAAAGVRLGHQTTVHTYGAGTKHRAACTCGYTSTRRRTPALAVEAAVHHLRKVVAESRCNGR